MDISEHRLFALGLSDQFTRKRYTRSGAISDDFDSSSLECATRRPPGAILLKLLQPRVNAAAKRMRTYLTYYLRKAKLEINKDGREYVFLNALLDSGAPESYVIDQMLSVITAGRDTTSSATQAAFGTSHVSGMVRRICKEIEDLDRQIHPGKSSGGRNT